MRKRYGKRRLFRGRPRRSSAGRRRTNRRGRGRMRTPRPGKIGYRL